jgi:hypothetical protein
MPKGFICLEVKGCYYHGDTWKKLTDKAEKQMKMQKESNLISIENFLTKKKNKTIRNEQ